VRFYRHYDARARNQPAPTYVLSCLGRDELSGYFLSCDEFDVCF